MTVRMQKRENSSDRQEGILIISVSHMSEKVYAQTNKQGAHMEVGEVF